MKEKKESFSSPPNDERRITRRIPLVRFVWYKVLDRELDEVERSLEGISKSCDISETGVGLYTTQHIPIGTPIFLEIATKRFNLSCIGKVAYSRNADGKFFRIGIRFVLLPPNDRVLLIEHFVKDKENQRDDSEENGDLC